MGQSAKLVMNLQIALIYEGFAEGLTLATKLGVDAPETDAGDSGIDGSAPASWMTKRLSC